MLAFTYFTVTNKPIVNTACQNKGTNLKHQRHRFGLFSQGCLGWMVSPPWAQKFWARAHSPGIRALISCQNRQHGTPQNPLKGELLAITHLLVGQLGPQCLGKINDELPPSTQLEKLGPFKISKDICISQ